MFLTACKNTLYDFYILMMKLLFSCLIGFLDDDVSAMFLALILILSGVGGAALSKSFTALTLRKIILFGRSTCVRSLLRMLRTLL